MKKYITITTLLLIIGLLVATRDTIVITKEPRAIDVSRNNINLIHNESDYACVLSTQIRDIWHESGEQIAVTDKADCYKQ